MKKTKLTLIDCLQVIKNSNESDISLFGTYTPNLTILKNRRTLINKTINLAKDIKSDLNSLKKIMAENDL